MNKIKRLRLSAKLSQTELANRVGCKQSLISGIETGAKKLSRKLAWKLAKALDVPAEKLLPSIKHSRYNAKSQNTVVRTFAEQLNKLRGEDSMGDFAKRLNILTPSAYKYDKGETVPNVTTIINICKACDVKASWLLGINEMQRFRRNKNSTFASRLRQIRGDHSQTSAAKLANINLTMWNLYELGLYTPVATNFVKICCAFNVDPDWLLGI